MSGVIGFGVEDKVAALFVNFSTGLGEADPGVGGGLSFGGVGEVELTGDGGSF